VDRSERVGRLTIRAALLLGFGATLALWLFVGYYFTYRFAQGRDEAASINSRFMRAQEMLATVRAQILLASVYARDALLDPAPRAVETSIANIQRTYGAMDDALAHYVPVLDSIHERERVTRLRRELDDSKRATIDILNGDQGAWTQQQRVALSRRVATRRDQVMKVSEDVQKLNRGAFVQQQVEMSRIYSETQRRMWWELGLGLTASIAIGLLAALHAGRLEGRLRRQQLRDAQNTHDLQRLSAQLITAQEEERRSMARELHDEIGQALTAIKVELAVAARAVEAGNTSPELLRDARSITDGTLQAVRDLSHVLHPAMLDDLGLPAAVDWYVRGFSKRCGIAAELLYEAMDERLSPEIEATAYRIIQEALTNVAKHAHATSCRVYIQRLQTTVLVTVEDNGRGFDLESETAADDRGLGLIAMGERVAHVSGTLRLESTPGKGTRVTAELPARPRTTVEEAVATYAKFHGVPAA
jgi:signal transduction histidine kinase